MNLYKKIYSVQASNSCKKIDIQRLIEIILKKVKQIAIAQMKRTMPNLNPKKFIGHLLYEIWEIKEKQIMINAAPKAGLIREDDDLSNFFTLEPEAASKFYQKSHQANNSIANSYKPLIVLDFGGGTVDIVTQKRILKENGMGFIEVIKPIGGKNGCNNINENFTEKIIKQLIGEDCFNKAKNAICKDRYNEWISLEKKNRRI